MARILLLIIQGGHPSGSYQRQTMHTLRVRAYTQLSVDTEPHMQATIFFNCVFQKHTFSLKIKYFVFVSCYSLHSLNSEEINARAIGLKELVAKMRN